MSQKHFTLTSFLCPLKEKVVLSENLGYYLDNPRTEYEVKLVYEYIKASYNSDFNIYPKLELDELRNSIKYLFWYNKLPEPNVGDPFLEIAKIWVVCFFGDKVVKTVGVELQENKQVDQILSYTEMVNFLLHCGHYQVAESFLIDKPIPIIFRFNEKIPLYIRQLVSLSQYNRVPEFIRVKREFKEIIPKLENVLNSENKELILYISEQFKYLKESRDLKATIVVLVGVLELLLTHNPAFNRFNIEDSISKQFLLKMSVVLNKFEGSGELKESKEIIKLIYKIRSLIAHGNFTKLNEILNKDINKRNSIN
jgi:hypothetical protein